MDKYNLGVGGPVDQVPDYSKVCKTLIEENEELKRKIKEASEKIFMIKKNKSPVGHTELKSLDHAVKKIIGENKKQLSGKDSDISSALKTHSKFKDYHILKGSDFLPAVSSGASRGGSKKKHKKTKKTKRKKKH